MGRVIAVWCLGVAGCATYQAGSLLAEDGHAGRHLSCLEVDAQVSEDDIGGATFVPATSPIVDVAFGNVCDHPVDVHFERLRYYGQWPDGTREPLVAFDPRAELRAGRIDSWSEGHEKLQLDTPTRGDPPAAICVDVSGLEGNREVAGHLLCRPFLPRVS